MGQARSPRSSRRASRRAHAAVQQADGKVVVAGVAFVPELGNPDNIDFAVVRYDAAGMLDSTFGGDGDRDDAGRRWGT